MAVSANTGFLPSPLALVKALSLKVPLCEDRNWSEGSHAHTNTLTHTLLEMLGWIKWQKYLLFSLFS